jgi:hypothetical protein
MAFQPYLETSQMAFAGREGKRVETRAQVVWLDRQGILRAITKPGANVTLADAEEVIVEISRLAAGVRRPIMINLSATRAITRDARKYLSGPEPAKVECAVALVVTSPLDRAIGNFFLGLNKSQIPTQLFSSEASALAWLQQFVPPS